MKKIIFCNNIKRLRTIVNRKKDATVKYLILKYDKESNRILELLKRDSRFISVSDREIKRNCSKDFQDKFVNFIARLNQENHSFAWWHLKLTNKNPISTQLCNKIFNLLTIVDFIRSKDIDAFLVITDDIELLKQFNIYAKNRPIKTINAISCKLSLKERIKKYTPMVVFVVSYKMLLASIYAKLYCKLRFDKMKNYAVVLSLLYQKSFTKEGVYRDAFFGDFVYYLNKKNIPFINLLITVTPQYKQMLKKLYSRSLKIPIVTVEYFLCLSDLIACLFYSLIRYFAPIKLKGNVEIDGIDLNYLVKMAIRNDNISASTSNSLRIYFAVRSLAKKIKINRFYYPFENRPFEKMAILALRSFSYNTRVIGYQHASISLKHTNFLLGKDEHKITPLPDIIITMGETTKNIMRDFGNFPEDILKIGCALRQNTFNGKLKDKKERISNILVVLATGIEEYIKVLKFLDKAFLEFDSCNLWIRPHPEFSLEEAVKITGYPRFPFYKANKEALDECYKWADIVLYVHSTLSIESILHGIPVLNIVLPDALNPDPLFNFSDFKWRAERPKMVLPIIEMIDRMDEKEYVIRQKRGREFAKKYIHEIDNESLEYFLKC